MSRSFKTEGIVLRSIRYGEADRILHIYSESHGRIGAIAKGARKTSSRFGGRLEPFFRLDMVLHRGRGDLATVTSAATIASHSSLRESRKALDAAAGGSLAVLRLMPESEKNTAVYNLICRYFALLESKARENSVDWATFELAFRMKLLIASGIAPELFRCAGCGSEGKWKRFSPEAGGVVCQKCGGGDFPIDDEALDFMRGSIAAPMSEVVTCRTGALKTVDRAVRETAEYHAHVSLTRVV